MIESNIKFVIVHGQYTHHYLYSMVHVVNTSPFPAIGRTHSLLSVRVDCPNTTQ